MNRPYPFVANERKALPQNRPQRQPIVIRYTPDLLLSFIDEIASRLGMLVLVKRMPYRQDSSPTRALPR